MMTLAKIVYWLMSVVAALLLALTAVYLVSIAFTSAVPDWWLHALSLALLAVCVWFVGWAFRCVVRRIVVGKLSHRGWARSDLEQAGAMASSSSSDPQNTG